MRQLLLQGCAVFGVLLCTLPAAAQQIVHALSGTVVKIDSQAKTLLLNTDDGSQGQFSLGAGAGVSLNFNKDVKEQVTPAAKFDKTDTEVVVCYYGDNAVRTAVAVKDLGAGPFVKVQGNVTGFNKHDHVLTIQDSAGKTQTFHIDPKGIADGPDGVVQADRLSPQKGDGVNITATSANGVQTAVFIEE